VHGAHLVHELRALLPGAEFVGLGGFRMQAAGVRTFHDMTKISALGLGDVLRNYFKYRKIFYDTIEQIKKEKTGLPGPDRFPGLQSPARQKVSKLAAGPLLHLAAALGLGPAPDPCGAETCPENARDPAVRKGVL